MKWGSQAGMSIAQANTLLGGPYSTAEAVKAAFATAVRASHPDTKNPTITEATVAIGLLQEARDVLTKALSGGLNQGQEIACKLCGGSGRVGTGFGAPCAACKGTGIYG